MRLDLSSLMRIDEILTKTSMDLSLHLAKNNDGLVSQLEYSQIIGSLLYITYPTHVDFLKRSTSLVDIKVT